VVEPPIDTVSTMIRALRLGGAFAPLPWVFFVVLGAACFVAAGAFVFLFPLWSTYFVVGAIEEGIFLAGGTALLVAGGLRRRRELKEALTPGFPIDSWKGL
jgi:hypothetical protein